MRRGPECAWKLRSCGRSAQMSQQPARAARVFGRDHRHLPQAIRRPWTQVGQIAYRSGDHIQRSGQVKCCLILLSSVALGTAPITVSTCRPFRKKRMLGMDRTLNRIAVR